MLWQRLGSAVEAQANLKLARIEQGRTRELFAQGVVSAQQRDEDAQVDMPLPVSSLLSRFRLRRER